MHLQQWAAAISKVCWRCLPKMLSAEDVEWIVPGEEWPLAGTHRGHAGLADLFQKTFEIVETSFPEPPEFVAQGDRVLVLGVSRGRVKATNRTFEDHFVFEMAN